MINKTFFIFILLFFLNNKAFSANIVVIDLEYLIENSTFFLEVVKKIELNQKKYLKEFNSEKVSKYIILKSMNINLNEKFLWD